MSGLGATPDQNEVREGAEEAMFAIIECLGKIRAVLTLHRRLEQLPTEHELSMELRGCVTAYVHVIRRWRSARNRRWFLSSGWCMTISVSMR